jgi:hypothetical protein
VTDGKYREKSYGKILQDLAILNKRYPGRGVLMTDSIMPLSSHKELIPRLNNEEYSHMHYHFQLKANLKLAELIHLKAAGGHIITPGIEALSTGLLGLLDKGVTAGENLNLLRYCRCLGIYAYWHILWGIPGDKASFYKDTLDLLPLIRHFQPPREINHIQLERTSVYLKNPSLYDIRDYQPLAAYRMIYPEWADIRRLGYFYTAVYPCESHRTPDLIGNLLKEWEIWRQTWKEATLIMKPYLNYYIIHDKRDVTGNSQTHVLERNEAVEVMTTAIYKESETLRWAVDRKLAVLVDGWYIPLVTASPNLLMEFEKEPER